MIKVAIVEDEMKEREKLRSYFEKLEKEIGTLYLLSFFSDGDKFLFDFHYGMYDLVLMDIELSGKDNGITVSEKLRKIDTDVILVFMTNLAQYAIEGYKVNAVDYIIKPISYFDFKARISSLSNDINSKHKEKVLIQTDGKKIVVLINDIYYIETVSHSLIYHTKTGEYKAYGALKTVQTELENFHFSMCNSCFLVNLEYVERVDGYTVTVMGNELQISHPRKKQFLKELSLFLGK